MPIRYMDGLYEQGRREAVIFIDEDHPDLATIDESLRVARGMRDDDILPPRNRQYWRGFVDYLEEVLLDGQPG